MIGVRTLAIELITIGEIPVFCPSSPSLCGSCTWHGIAIWNQLVGVAHQLLQLLVQVLHHLKIDLPSFNLSRVLKNIS